jgi:hypothetical protein
LRRLAAITLAILVALGAFTVALPAQLQLLAVAAALIAGVGLERYRQYRAPMPPPLRETPAAWRDLIADEVGLPFAAAALLLAAAAAAVLIVSLPGKDTTTQTALVSTPPAAGTPPQVPTRREPAGRGFMAAGVDFRVTTGAAVATGSATQLADPGADRRWVTAVVTTANVTRKTFDPAMLDFRLRTSHGALIYPDQHGATGPDGLAETGTLRRGQKAQVQLAFRVPSDARGLTLLFEPGKNGSRQVQVPLDSAAP